MQTQGMVPELKICLYKWRARRSKKETNCSSLVIKEFIKGNLHTRCVLQLQDEMYPHVA